MNREHRIHLPVEDTGPSGQGLIALKAQHRVEPQHTTTAAAQPSQRSLQFSGLAGIQAIGDEQRHGASSDQASGGPFSSGGIDVAGRPRGGPRPDHARRIAADDGVRRHVFGHDGAGRDNRAVASTLQALKVAARDGANTMYPLLDCVRAYATVGEMCDALRDVWGEYEESVVI